MAQRSLMDTLKELLPAEEPGQASRTRTGAREVSKGEPAEVQASSAQWLPLLALGVGLVAVLWAARQPQSGGLVAHQRPWPQEPSYQENSYDQA